MSKTNRVNTFSVGDRVSWESQAGGHSKKKTGTIIEVVPAGRFPKEHPNKSTRRHVSYVVEVASVVKLHGKHQVSKRLKKPERYWPLVTNLRLVRRGSTSAPGVARPAPDGSKQWPDSNIATAGEPNTPPDVESMLDKDAPTFGGAGLNMEHASDCPQGGPPRDGEPCCDKVERDPEAEYAAAEEARATEGLERFCDPDALGDAAQAGIERAKESDLSGSHAGSVN